MQGLNLTYTDRASMAASVEVRVPFIDKEVVELALAIKGSLKYKNRTQKYLLKKVGERHLPKNIIYRPKASFGAPIRSWISGSLSPMVQDLLNFDAIKNRGIFNPTFVENLIREDKEGKKDNAYQIYQLLTIELWLKNFVDS
jgi:asparagine synthase (glutamine-hydrolysing)